jgi:DNA mismatch repair protein MutS
MNTKKDIKTRLVNILCKMTIYDDYIAYHDKYILVYGEKTIVFLQVGDFFELYGVQNETEQVGPDMYAIGDICGLVVTRKNKSITENSRGNPLMMGFPIHAFQKHAQLLVSRNYTVVVIRQVTPPPNVQRKVTEIISPSTFLSTTNQTSVSNYLMAFLWEEKHVGIAGVDLSTGHTWLYEVNTRTDALEETYRLLQVYAPKEILLRGSVSEEFQKQIEEVTAHPCSHIEWTMPSCNIAKQNQVFQTAFPSYCQGLLSPIEQLDLEKMYLGRLALVYVLQFAYDHNDMIIQRLLKPEIILPEKYLTLEYNSAIQLNIISQYPHEKPLLDLLNRTHTTLGSRLFREWLLQPLTNIVDIEYRYERVTQMMENRKYDIYGTYLRKIVDLERAIRRMVMKTFGPMDWVSIATTMEAAIYILGKEHHKIVRKIQNAFSCLNMDECAKYNLSDIRTNIFVEGCHPTLDAKMQILKEQFAFYDASMQEIGKELCRLDCNDRDGYSICMTKKRWETYRTGATGVLLPVKEIHVKPISHTSSVVRLQHPKLETASQRILEVQHQLQLETLEIYQQFVQRFLSDHQEDVHHIAQALAEMDVFCTCAKNATEYGYCRPTLKNEESYSWFDAKGLRHPIIERLQSQIAYVSNDIAMGANGILLYGVNSSGKSSFMKAIGLNILMAQAGMFVAAREFVYSPYRHIFTRIASTDNLFRGMSSFVVEMTELRTILHRANPYSLVLGDELCAGTESVSALSIVAAGVDSLVQQKATFLFATHLHELTDILSERQEVRVAHMHIEIENDKIIYQRKLENGKGNPMYGLEVCHALGLPTEFLKKAQSYRRQIMKIPSNLVTEKVSRYNTNVVMSKCRLCGNPATETHHIIHQEDADKNGFVKDGVYVHHSSNLIPLCESCHQKQHHDNVEITGYVQTTKGIEVVMKEKSTRRAKAKSTSLEEMKQTIMYIPMTGWKKKTVKGTWRTTLWDKVKEKLETNINEEEAIAIFTQMF